MQAHIKVQVTVSYLYLQLYSSLYYFPYFHLTLTLLTSAMSTPEPDIQTHGLILPDLSGAVPTSIEARAKRRIAALEEELQTMKQERGTKQRFVTNYFCGYSRSLIFKRKTTYYVAQGRVVCRMVILYTSLEDLVAENDRRYKEDLVDDMAEGTPE